MLDMIECLILECGKHDCDKDSLTKYHMKHLVMEMTQFRIPRRHQQL